METEWDRRHKILSLLDEGYSYNQVAKRMGCTRNSVAGIAFRWNPEKGPRRRAENLIRVKQAKAAETEARLAERKRQVGEVLQTAFLREAAREWLKWYAEGLTMTEVAERAGRTRQRISQVVREAGIKGRALIVLKRPEPANT